MGIISFISAHWLEWLFTAVLAVLSWLFKLMRDQLRQELHGYHTHLVQLREGVAYV